MRKFLRTMLLVLLGVIIFDFSLANRHLVTVSFDPFASGDSAFDLPPQRLFVVIIAALMLGVLVGGSATWFRQRRWRRAARQHEADARALRTQLADWRAHADMSRRQDQASPAVVPQVGYRRDKQGATL
jgi:uncharacterized integral membrane protein